jgi:hypothetical protein
MYLINTQDATSMTARFRMADHLCLASVAEAFKQGRRIAGADSHGHGAAVPASFESVTGVQAWSPPV